MRITEFVPDVHVIPSVLNVMFSLFVAVSIFEICSVVKLSVLVSLSSAPGSSFVLLMSCLLTEIFVMSSFIVTEVPSLKFSPVVVIFPFLIVKLILSATVYPSGAVVSVSV